MEPQPPKTQKRTTTKTSESTPAPKEQPKPDHPADQPQAVGSSHACPRYVQDDSTSHAELERFTSRIYAELETIDTYARSAANMTLTSASAQGESVVALTALLRDLVIGMSSTCRDAIRLRSNLDSVRANIGAILSYQRDFDTRLIAMERRVENLEAQLDHVALHAKKGGHHDPASP